MKTTPTITPYDDLVRTEDIEARIEELEGIKNVSLYLLTETNVRTGESSTREYSDWAAARSALIDRLTGQASYADALQACLSETIYGHDFTVDADDYEWAVTDASEDLERLSDIDREDLKFWEEIASQGRECDEWHHGTTLIRDSYFVTHAQEIVEGIHGRDDYGKWPFTCIDWDWAAKELKYDYYPLSVRTHRHGREITYWITA